MSNIHNQEHLNDGAPNNQNQEALPSDLVSVQTAGEFIGRNTNTIYFWIKGDSLKKYSSPSGETLVSQSEAFALHLSKPKRPRGPKSPAPDMPITPPEETGSNDQTPEIPDGPLPENENPQHSVAGASVELLTADAAVGSIGEVVDEPVSEIPANVKLSSDGVERKVEIRLICFDPETQMRCAMDKNVIHEYAEKMKRGERFPPVVLFEDDQGKFLIGDGWHRLSAAKRNQYHNFPAEVRAGGRSAAMRYALRANVTHGLRLTSKDKRRKVNAALREYPTLSNNEIAAICGVSESLVRGIRDRFAKNEPAVRTGADGKQYPARKARHPKGNSKQNVIFKRTTDLLQKLPPDLLQRLKVIVEEQLARIVTGASLSTAGSS